MGIYVNTNASAMRGRNQLNNVNNKLDTTYQRLSSGLRINSAKDDAAGLAICDRMTSQINGLNQGNRNAADAIALCQTMEGAIDEIGSSVQQIRTLAVQAMNGTNTSEDRVALAGQIAQLFSGISDTVSNTKFGGKTMLQGYSTASIFGVATTGNVGSSGEKGGKITFQIGANGGDTMSLELANFGFVDSDANKGAQPAKTGIMGALVEAFYATATTTAHGTPGSLASVKAGAADPKIFSIAASNENFLKACDKAIQQIDEQRATLGATQNRLESTIRNQENVIANQSDARSRIRDTDFAEESAKLSQYNIIQQAAMSMLMQANARPQLALSMLGN